MFTPESIKSFLAGYEGYAILVYAIISMVKGFVMLPNTPFVLAGVMLFPDQPWLVFSISLGGIMIGGSFIHLFADKLELMKKTFEKGDRPTRMKKKLQKHGFWIVLFWAFFPLTPTNLICYVAGAAKMPYPKFAFGLLLGQLPLIIIYVFTGEKLLQWLF